MPGRGGSKAGVVLFLGEKNRVKSLTPVVLHGVVSPDFPYSARALAPTRLLPANGCNAKTMAPTCAEPSDALPLVVCGHTVRRARNLLVVCGRTADVTDTLGLLKVFSGLDTKVGP